MSTGNAFRRQQKLTVTRQRVKEGLQLHVCGAFPHSSPQAPQPRLSPAAKHSARLQKEFSMFFLFFCLSGKDKQNASDTVALVSRSTF